MGGGTEILIHVALPARMPTDDLTVKFVCTPKKGLEDPELEALAPMRRDAAEIINPCKETMAKLPLAGALEVPAGPPGRSFEASERLQVIAFLDPMGRGVCCVSPPMDAESVDFYNYSVMVSLDGHNYMPRQSLGTYHHMSHDDINILYYIVLCYVILYYNILLLYYIYYIILLDT